MARRETVTVVLISFVGVISIVTGVASLSYHPYMTPLAGYVPPAVRTAVSLTGAFTGFAMFLSARGLGRRLRLAWYTSLVLLPVTALQGVVQSNVLSVPLVVLSVASIPVLLFNRSGFSRSLTLNQGQWAAVGALGSALLYGTVGSYALRDGYRNIETPLDALYYTVITISTVGYGDAVPTTQLARTFSISFIVAGTAAFAFSLGTLITPAIEARLSKALGRMTQRQLDSLEGHVVVLGYSDLTEPVLAELKDRAEIVVVAPDAQVASKLRERGYIVVNANPSNEDALTQASIEAASAVVAATNDDAEDALAVLTARQMNPDLRVVVSAADEGNVEKLKRAGADTVISPASIVGDLLVESALTGEDTGEVVDDMMEEEFSGEDESNPRTEAEKAGDEKGDEENDRNENSGNGTGGGGDEGEGDEDGSG